MPSTARSMLRRVRRRAGNLVTFGITPTQPETGYGYIRQGAELTGHPGVFQVDAFVEKPRIETAQDMLAAGGHFWNSGMFLFSAAKLLAEMEKLRAGHPSRLPRQRSPTARAISTSSASIRKPSAARPAISIDYAVMERTDAAVVVPATIGWTDVGAWSALWDIGAKDEDGNVSVGDVMTEDAQNCYIRSEGVLTAVVGHRTTWWSSPPTTPSWSPAATRCRTSSALSSA